MINPNKYLFNNRRPLKGRMAVQDPNLELCQTLCLYADFTNSCEEPLFSVITHIWDSNRVI